jgi:phage terminase large subunit-like protein
MTDKVKPLRRGLVKPRLHTPLLKGKSRIDEVAELAEKIGYPLLPWQHFVLEDMLRVNAEGQFIRKTNLVLCARQNGKTHLARMRILAGMFLFDEKKILIMSSNRGMALSTFREVAYAIEGCPELKAQVKAIRYANGTESIELLNGARLDVVAATRDGSRGRTADLLFIDEVREITEEGYAAALPTTRARPNAQTLLASNSGDAFSTVLNSLRERALSNPSKTFGFYEYSAPQFAKITDRQGWIAANPALGHTITMESIEEALNTQSVEQFRTETLCQWIDSLQSPWPYGSIEATSDNSLKMSPGPLTVFAFDVSPSRRDASLVMGQLLPDGRVGVAVLETYNNQVAVDELKIAASIKGWCDLYYPRTVCFDKYTTASIAKRLELSGVAVRDVSGAEFYTACSDLHDALSNGRLAHSGQELLVQHMNNAAAKINDSAWRIVRRKSAGPVDIAIGLAMVIHVLAQPVQEAKIYA